MDRLKLAWTQRTHHHHHSPARGHRSCLPCSVHWLTGHPSLNRVVIFILLFLFISLNLIDLQDMLRFYRHKIHWLPKDDANGGGQKQNHDQEVGARERRPGVALPRDAAGKLSHASQRHLNHRLVSIVKTTSVAANNAVLLANFSSKAAAATPPAHRRAFRNHKHRHAGRHRYLVHTKTCRMIEWPVYDEETGPIVDEFRERTFSCRQPLIKIERLNGTLLYVEGVGSGTELQCFVDELISTTGDTYTFRKRFGPLKSPITDFPKLDAVRIECFKHMKPLHSPLKVLTKVESKVVPLVPFKVPKHKKPANANQPNVLLLGIDSVSWLNFKRYFPKSKQFLETHNFVPLYGFTKVGDNTFPNMMGVLTGNHYTRYWNSSIGYNMRFDDVPLIWKKFSKQGYLTALVEDMPSYSLFNYGRAGFTSPPTDYYMRPVSILVDDDLNNHFCYKGQIGMEYYYSWILDQVTTLKDRAQPFFTFAHLADLTHNNFWAAGKADQPLHQLLSELVRRGITQNTFIFLLADHGIRFGRMRRTRSGQMEERLPFFYLFVPEGNQQQTGDNSRKTPAEQLRATLRANAHRLTSHFDLHATLRHIVEKKAPTTDDEPYGRSLFTPIPPDRTCESAGISEKWCLCSQFDNWRSGTEEAKAILGHFVAGQVNLLLGGEPKCAQLQLDQVEEVLIRTEPLSADGSDLFTVQAVLEPGGGLFDATLRVDNSSLLRLNHAESLLPAKVPHIHLIGDISRLNAYGNQSACIDDSILEKYCFCITSNLDLNQAI